MCRPRCGPWWFVLVEACVNSDVDEVPPAFRESFERVEVTDGVAPAVVVLVVVAVAEEEEHEGTVGPLTPPGVALVAPPPAPLVAPPALPEAATVPPRLSAPMASSISALRAELLITFMRFSRPITDGMTSASKMKLASMIGSRASPRDLSVPSRSCSARSRMILSSACPSGIRLSSASRSDSWFASFTSSGLVLAGGRDSSSPNRHTQNARKAHLDSVAEASTLSWCEIGLMLCFLPFFFGGGGRSIIRFGGCASISSASRTPRVHASRPCPCACSPSARANRMSHASSDGLMLEKTCCCCFDSDDGCLSDFDAASGCCCACCWAAVCASDTAVCPVAPLDASLSSAVPSFIHAPGTPTRLALCCFPLEAAVKGAPLSDSFTPTDCSTMFSTSYSLMLPEIS
uniref:Uncharacterized protein n=1 Tax=Anopheles atroparvus TaxID=41427 RepID=A0A182IND4_ANOAO